MSRKLYQPDAVITLLGKPTEKHLPSLSHGINTLKGLTVLDQWVAIKPFFKSVQKAMSEMTGLNTANLWPVFIDLPHPLPTPCNSHQSITMDTQSQGVQNIDLFHHPRTGHLPKGCQVLPVPTHTPTIESQSNSKQYGHWADHSVWVFYYNVDFYTLK